MSRLKIFEEFDNIDAFFTQKPEKTVELIPAMAKALPVGEYFIKPWMVHGCHVQTITEDFLRGPHVEAEGYPELKGVSGYVEVPDTDGLVTDIPGVALVTTHGDCIPVQACDPVKGVVGVAHAGWKGTLGGIAGILAETMKREYGCRSEDIHAYVGPGIDKCCFEVMDDVCSKFRAEKPWMNDFIRVKDAEHYLIDLKVINRRFLEEQGVGHIEVSPECTCCRTDLYWSYRRTKTEFRMLSYIRLKTARRP